MKKIFSWLSVIVIIGVLILIISLQRVDAPVVVQDVAKTISAEVSPSLTAPNITTEMIEVTSPLPSTTLTSPVTISGRARGPWYFEASFPIELRDANNVLIGKAIAQAQSDWMTEDFVPFTAVLTFPAQPAGSQGVLTLKNDNPSGEPQNSMMFDIAVVF